MRASEMLAYLQLTVIVMAATALANPARVHGQSMRERLSGLESFSKQFCVDCHNSDHQQGGLAFDELLHQEFSLANERTWMQILARVAEGEMPPEDAAQPSSNLRDAFVQRLTTALHDSSAQRQQREGRVAWRRLNRREYQYILQDLLGSHVNVMDYLPEDNVAGGFDNVSEALDVSAVHLLRYQEAAEAAIRSVIPNRVPTPVLERLTGREIVERSKTRTAQLGRTIRLDGEAMIVYARNPSNTACATPAVSHPGRYRVRAMLTSVGSGDSPLAIQLTPSGSVAANSDEDRRTHDIPPNRPIIIREAFDLNARGVVVFNGWDLPRPHELQPRGAPISLENYNGPGLVVDWIEIIGPIDPFPFEGYQRLFGETPLVRRVSWDPNSLEPRSPAPKADAERLVRSLLPIAFRRPVDPQLADYYVRIAHDQLDAGKSLAEALVATYMAVFCSPHFLFLVEPLPGIDPSVRQAESRLDDFAIATRLSTFLWSSHPDDELLTLANRGELHRPEVLSQQVERMLEDPKSDRFVRAFTDQWLDLKEIDATTPDPGVYVEFDDFLFWSMPRETRGFFREVLSYDLSVVEFVSSEWSFLNQRLARHYGIADVQGGQLHKVQLPENSHRGGVITQAAVMKVTADGARTSPVIRGNWVLDRILGQPAKPPPANTPAIDPDTRGAVTIRQQLDRHRNDASCNACHQYIDPHGFALESFDAIGGWREFYRARSRDRVPLHHYPAITVGRGADVERGGQMADGREFDGIDEYRKILVTHQDPIVRNLVTKLIVYATGAELQFADRQVVDQIVRDLEAKQFGLRSMIHAITQSRLFLCK